MELISKLDSNEVEALREATNWIKMEWDEFRILDLCTQSGLTESNWEAKKMIQSGAIYCNEEKISDIQKVISKSDAVNWVLLLRKGKKVNKAIVLS
jgi:tyrosyl-tRNA synthetase